MSDASTSAKTPLYSAPEGLERPLRVVLVGPPRVPGWIDAFVHLVEGYDWIELTPLAAEEATLPQVAHVRADLRALVAFEHLAFGANRSLARVPMPGQYGVANAEPLTSRVAALQADLVIVLGPQALARALAAHAPLGCWHVDASLLDNRHAGLSLLSPLLHREMATQMALVLHDSAGRQSDLASSWGRTHATSFLKQREDAFRKLPALLIRGLRRLAAGYVPATPHEVVTLQLPSQPPVGLGASVQALRLLARASLRWLSGKQRNRRRIGWSLVLRLGGTPLDPSAPAIGSHVLLRAEKGWWADPFVITAQGRKLLFVEEMEDPKRNNANIACVELSGGGACRLGVALDEPGHLSFPQVFEWEGQWYLTVESSYDRRVSLYRSAGFPLQWERMVDLVTGRVCVDPTLHHHDGRWYLFANVSENGNSTADELFLFVADKLEGPYVPHPASPIVCDVRRARMAGRLFHHHGRLIRPAQDCGPGYGNAVVFNEVLELGPTVYRERQLSRLAPFLVRRVDGCHTYNVDGGVEVLDVLGRQPSKAPRLQVFEGARPATAGDGQQTARREPMAPPRAFPGMPPR
ncbi:glucosamine inositolphosphorylceramide transferase family protein [Lysobacter solisilvae (ex Woo and Kim 2020)]|uniref:Glucosamine inositolphosphorylceramide transferase 1 N-terminal domain-containing protein n=1 Tax=Agrilutibacter terrestris TaxID=2865112 RepID=A0A7H0FXC1_9GAMM|nr:hypothetical protein [Lysobacter terrestris]QNP40687.1 hypothetical protein H8B22_14710 [Lysobacter terrestris]